MDKVALPHDIAELTPWQGWPWEKIFTWTLVVLAIAAGVWLWRRWQKHRKPKVVAVRERDVFAELIKRATNLRPSMPFERTAQIEYFYELGFMLREFIEHRWRIRATDQTMDELRGPLRRTLPFDESEVKSVIRFLERSDLVKFANEFADVHEADSARAQVLLWFSQFRPQPKINQDVRLS